MIRGLLSAGGFDEAQVEILGDAARSIDESVKAIQGIYTAHADEVRVDVALP